MTQHSLRKGVQILIGSERFIVLKKLDNDRWQLENEVTGEWSVFAEHDLLDRYTQGQLAFSPAKPNEGDARVNDHRKTYFFEHQADSLRSFSRR